MVFFEHDTTLRMADKLNHDRHSFVCSVIETRLDVKFYAELFLNLLFVDMCGEASTRVGG